MNRDRRFAIALLVILAGGCGAFMLAGPGSLVATGAGLIAVLLIFARGGQPEPTSVDSDDHTTFLMPPSLEWNGSHVLRLDREGRITAWIGCCQALTGLPLQTVLGHPLMELVEEGQLPNADQTADLTFGHDESTVACMRAHRADLGEETYLILTDVTEDLVIQQELRQRETELSAVFNTIQEQVFLIDPDGTIRNANSAARTFYRIGEGDTDLLSIIRQPEDPPASDPIKRCLANFEPTFAEQHLANQHRTVHVHVYPIFDQRGRLRQMVFLERDVTNERLMELEIRVQHRKLQSNLQRLRELDQAKSEWINSISHELRTPLTSIRSYSEILLTYADTDAETREEFLQIIVQESERLTRLINDLLDMARIESGRMHWDFGRHDIGPVITDTVRSLRSLAENVQVQLEVIAPDDSIIVETDRDRLQQVLVNLVSNAIKFSPPSSRVAISLSQHDDEAVIAVEDEGPGIPPAKRAVIFERFTQVTDNERGKPAGSGLGLTISKQLMESMHGRVQCVGPQVLDGACFVIRHPLRQPAGATSNSA